MKKIVRLTESELTNVIKRIVQEQQATPQTADPKVQKEKTKMQPIVVKEIPLVNGPNGATALAVNSGEKTPSGGNQYQDITVKGNYTLDPKTGQRSTNFVDVSFFIAPSLFTSLTYDCTNKKVVRTGGTVTGKLPSQVASVALLGKKVDNKRSLQSFTEYGNALYNMTKNISTTSGPAAEVIQYYCSAS